MNLVDSSGWLEFFSNTPNAKNFTPIILDVPKLIVPTIVLYEVFKKILIEFDENKALVAIGHMKLGNVVSIGEDIAINAAKISFDHKMPMADSIIYALALTYNATVYTQDVHFKNLKNVKFFKK